MSQLLLMIYIYPAMVAGMGCGVHYTLKRTLGSKRLIALNKCSNQCMEPGV